MPAILQRGDSRNMSSDKDNSKSEDLKDDDMKNDEGVDVLDEEADKSEEEEKEKKEPPKKRGAKAKEAKKKEESEDENEEDEDESGDEKVPLLDQPLELSGSRERKKVERFTEEFSEPKESKTVDIPKGRGTALGEIPRTEDYIKKFKADALKPLHRILFNRVGKVTMVKNNIRKFNGFDFDKGSDMYDKKKNMLSKIEVSTLKTVCCILDLDRGGRRDDLAQRILNFLLEPKSSGKPVENRPKRNTAQKSNNKSYSESDEDSEKRPPRSKRTSGRKKNLKEVTSDEEEEETEKNIEKPKPKGKKAEKQKQSEEEEEEADEEEEAESEGEPSSDESGAKANKGSRGRGNAKKPALKKNNAKKMPNKKVEKKAAPKKKKTSKSDDDSSEDEPLTKKVKAPPSDEEIKTYVKEILEGANLEEITMKTVCKQVYANYPDFDLSHKKDFIKTTVKSLIST